MGLHLPTDTQHLALETRQYEIFDKSLGQGIPRRRIYLSALACALWWLPLAMLAVNPLTKLGPTVYLLPPFVFVFFGTRLGDDGRMRLMRWYDAILAWAPARHRMIGNPLLPAARHAPAVIHLADCIVELHPDRHPRNNLTSHGRNQDARLDEDRSRRIRARVPYADLPAGGARRVPLAGDGG